MLDMRRVARLAIGGVVISSVVMTAAWLMASIDLPLGRDQGIFAWVGETILRGGLPYVDAWDVKGPGAHALYALAIAMFGPTEQGIRWFDTVFQLAGLAAFLRIGLSQGRPLAGVMGFAIAVGAGISGSWWDSAQPDGWAGILLVWSGALLIGRRVSLASMAGACLLIGVATSIKPLYLLFGLVPLLQLLQAPDRGRRRLLLLAAVVGGGLLVEDNDDNNLMQKTSRAYLGDFPELESFIARYYVPVASNAHYVAYARR